MKIALSLFDGMSCGQLALQRAGVSVDYYLASEVDKAAIAVATKNWPDMVHLGDVREVDGTQLQRPFILMGGSPCQAFSFAGKRNGMSSETGEKIVTLERYLELKAEGFEFDGQSYLFWEYVRMLRETRPKYFLLENVRMQKKWRDVIDQSLGVKGIDINSALVSAQNRGRIYWTNIPGVSPPEDRGIYLRDIWDNQYAREITETVLRKVPGTEAHKKTFSACVTLDQKSKCLMTGGQGVANSGATNIWINGRYYAPGPVLVERLQTLPDDYTKADAVSPRERERMIGNGWTVDVIAHILSYIPEEEK